MKILTEDADLCCDHQNGKVDIEPTQSLVTINGRRVLVATNPEGRSIKGCPNYGATIKPCVNTLKVKQGYSGLVSVEGRSVCLDSVKGLTDGMPPGAVEYKVIAPGQDWVDCAG